MPADRCMELHLAEVAGEALPMLSHKAGHHSQNSHVTYGHFSNSRSRRGAQRGWGGVRRVGNASKLIVGVCDVRKRSGCGELNTTVASS